MALNVNNGRVQQIYLGSSKVNQVFLGENQLFPKCEIINERLVNRGIFASPRDGQQQQQGDETSTEYTQKDYSLMLKRNERKADSAHEIPLDENHQAKLMAFISDLVSGDVETEPTPLESLTYDERQYISGPTNASPNYLLEGDTFWNKTPQTYSIWVMGDKDIVDPYAKGVCEKCFYNFDNYSYGAYWGTYWPDVSPNSIDLPNATIIEDDAFNYCSNLRKINIPNVIEIGEDAFQQSGVEMVDLPNATTVNTGAFRYSPVKYLIAPKLETTGWYAFSSTKIKDLNLPKLQTIGPYSFAYCGELESICIPSASYTGRDAFIGCTSLVEVNLPQLDRVGTAAFAQCSQLETAILENVTFLEQYAFVSCHSLKTVHLPKAKTVDAYAFQFSEIEELDLPQATQIGRMTFQDCKLLKRLNLPSMTKADVEANVSEWKIGQNYENDCTITCFGGETVVVPKS